MQTAKQRLLILSWIGALALTLVQLEVRGNQPVFFDDFPVLVENVQIYPNPVTENKISVRSAVDIRSVEIYNILGKLILRDNEITENRQEREIYLDNIPDGVYLLKVTLTNGQRFTEKILLEE